MNVLQVLVMKMLIAQITKVDLLVRVMKDIDQLVGNVKVRNQFRLKRLHSKAAYNDMRLFFL